MANTTNRNQAMRISKQFFTSAAAASGASTGAAFAAVTLHLADSHTIGSKDMALSTIVFGLLVGIIAANTVGNVYDTPATLRCWWKIRTTPTGPKDAGDNTSSSAQPESSPDGCESKTPG